MAPALPAQRPGLAAPPARQAERYPYGIALAIGALMIYPETEWIKAVDLTHLAMR